LQKLCDSSVYLRQDLDIAVRGIYSVFCSLANEYNEVQISLKDLSKICKLSLRSMPKYLEILQSENLVKKIAQRNKNLRVYTLPCRLETKPNSESKSRNKGKNELQQKDMFLEQRKQIIDYLNQQATRNFTHTRKETIESINVWLQKGYTVADFKKIIDNKVADWLNDPNMDKNLNPITLFRSSHFEKYLNENTAKLKKPKNISNKGLNQDKYESFYL